MRTQNLFAGASVVLLILGLILSNLHGASQSFSVTWPGAISGYALGYNVPCYGLAGLFAVFACSYSVGWIRLSQTVSVWHLCLSLFGVAVFGLAFTVFALVATQDARTPSQPTLWTVLIGLIAGPVLFLAGQIIFAIAAIKTFVVHHP